MALRAGNDSGHGVDPAALLGVVLAAVIAIFLPEGPWGPFAIIIGAILCFVILGYYKADLTLQFWRALAQALALGAVGGLCFMILVAYPFQQGWVQHRVEGKCQRKFEGNFPHFRTRMRRTFRRTPASHWLPPRLKRTRSVTA